MKGILRIIKQKGLKKIRRDWNLEINLELNYFTETRIICCLHSEGNIVLMEHTIINNEASLKGFCLTL